MFAWLVCAALLNGDGPDGVVPEPAYIAAAIDEQLSQRFAAEQITPAPLADDEEFLRRISLDLIGRIPKPDEIAVFSADQDSDKRDRLIARMLDDAEHAAHFARVWRCLLLPEATVDRQLRYFQPGLEAWLADRRARDVGFDTMVRELIAVPVAAAGESPRLVLTDLRAPNALAYIASKEADPAKLAASTARLFLGVRLECAQCHDHPFDRWTHADFWSQAAFFAGLKKTGSSPFAPLVEDVARRSITPMESTSIVTAAFLTSGEPLAESAAPRNQFADWLGSPANEQFAKASVNRIWGQLLGTGLVDPLDDFHEQNAPSHPEILSLLASAFMQSDCDLDVIYAAICMSDAYQRTSRLTDISQTERTYARMSVKPQSGEQFFDSLAQAVGYENSTTPREDDPVRRRFLDLFADQEPYGAPETSVDAALMLMNGGFINSAASPESSRQLQSLLQDANQSTETRIQTLYRATLSRSPTIDELTELVQRVGALDDPDYPRRLGNVLWMLLNSAEFRWNH